jgi:hypothetical protein
LAVVYFEDSMTLGPELRRHSAAGPVRPARHSPRPGDTLDRLAAAAGVLLSTDVRSAGDMSAIGAARHLLSPDVGLEVGEC